MNCPVFVENFVRICARDTAQRLGDGVRVARVPGSNAYDVTAPAPSGARSVRVKYAAAYDEQCRALALAVEQVLGLAPMPPEATVWFVFGIDRRARTVTLSREMAGIPERTVPWDAARFSDGRSFDAWESADCTPVLLGAPP
jgi:hypothetical protein